MLELEQDLIKLGVDKDRQYIIIGQFRRKLIELKDRFRYLFSLGMTTDMTFEEYVNRLDIEQFKIIFGLRLYGYILILKN